MLLLTDLLLVVPAQRGVPLNALGFLQLLLLVLQAHLVLDLLVAQDGEQVLLEVGVLVLQEGGWRAEIGCLGLVRMPIHIS